MKTTSIGRRSKSCACRGTRFAPAPPSSRDALRYPVGASRPGRALVRFRGVNHQRQQPDPESPVQVELGQLRGHEGMHGAVDGATTQQVHAAPAELPGARTREYEAWRRRALQNGVDDGQEFRNPLNFVDHHRVLSRVTPQAAPGAARAELRGDDAGRDRAGRGTGRPGADSATMWTCQFHGGRAGSSSGPESVRIDLSVPF